MARSHAQDIIRCQYCEEEPALFQCVPCGDELCPRCKTFHLKSKVPSGHNVIPISERLHPTNKVKMCESHPTKPYDACCEDCQVPVCILCIQEIHNTHRIGKMQDMYEKQKAAAIKELSEMKIQRRADIIQRIKDVENGLSRITTSHENLRREMKRQAKDFMDHINAILNEGLSESESDEKKKLEELSQHKAELEEYQQNLEHVIEKLENLTESSSPADLILYRKQNPDVIKHLKFPDTVVTTDPTFTTGQFNKTLNEKQFGQMTKSQLTRVKTDDTTQYTQTKTTETQPTQWFPLKSDEEKAEEELQKRRKGKLVKTSLKCTLLLKTVLQHPGTLSDIKPDKKVLSHVACVGDKRAYISGSGSGILLIDRSSTHLDTIGTSGEPSGLAVMKDGSLIYSVREDCAIYRVSPNKQITKLVNTPDKPVGLCLTGSGEILVCLDSRAYLMLTSTVRVRVVRYNCSGTKIQEFQISQNMTGVVPREWPICENVNADICTVDMRSDHMYKFSARNRVVVYDKSGNHRFQYGRRGGTQKFDHLEPRGLATDSLGHILISDGFNHVVHLISQDGQFIAYILTKDDGIACPWGIAVDQSDNLWLVEHKGSRVKVYQYLS
ncbi:E3 ubiquitin-protein ligase TRIM71-like [Ostrea edulis]|uniref:E3 ubiquitin-protein ligase TRIM71-like n=1 Tax=Ostrea edulis TaxID=37623 RepID=UPI0024AE97D7|nr:E3 ubiquitin-protein ligase TRIM71-like [Ostrea edulis]